MKANDVSRHSQRGNNANCLLPWVRSCLFISWLDRQDGVSKRVLRAMCSLQPGINYTSATIICWNEVYCASGKVSLYAPTDFLLTHEVSTHLQSIVVTPLSQTQLYLMVRAIAKSIKVTLSFGVELNVSTSRHQQFLDFGHMGYCMMLVLNCSLPVYWLIFVWPPLVHRALMTSSPHPYSSVVCPVKFSKKITS